MMKERYPIIRQRTVHVQHYKTKAASKLYSL